MVTAVGLTFPPEGDERAVRLEAACRAGGSSFHGGGTHFSWANFLAPHTIRVNSGAPTTVRTPMAGGGGDIKDILAHSPEPAGSLLNAIAVDMIESIDVSNAILWLVSDDARYVTGTVLPVDAGNINRR